MNKLLVVIASFLVLFLLYWFAQSIWDSGDYNSPKMVEFSNTYIDVVGVSPEKVKEAFECVEGKIEELNKNGSLYKGWSSAADWISFALTAIITLIAGLYGQGNQLVKDPENLKSEIELRNSATQLTSGKGNLYKLIKFIGFMAASAAVCTALSSKLNDRSIELFNKADSLTARITEVREKLLNESTEQVEIIRIYNDLKSYCQRN